MAKKFYIGIDNVARRVEKPYAEVGGVARAITKGYIGIDSIARQVHPDDPVTYIGTTWRFRSDIDYDEWIDFIHSHCENDSYAILAFDISFTCPDGIATVYYNDVGDPLPTVTYDFSRMEFHDNYDEGDSIYYLFDGEYAMAGAGGTFDEGSIITLNEEPSEVLLALLKTFAEEITEVSTDHYIGTTWKFKDFYQSYWEAPWALTSMLGVYIDEHGQNSRYLSYDIRFTAGNGVTYNQIYIYDSSNTVGSEIRYRDDNNDYTVAVEWKKASDWEEGYEQITLNEAPSIEFLDFIKIFAERQYNY